MIVNTKLAEEAWTLLRQHARIVDEKWDADLMCNPANLNESLIQEAYRIGARYTHPDAGGTLEAFAAVDRAKHILLEWLKRRAADTPAPAMPHQVCHRCSGKGFLLSQHGFKKMRQQCGSCRGTGELDYEHDNGAES